MSTNEKQGPAVTIASAPRRTSTDSFAPSLRTPRTARFAEATAIISPIEPKKVKGNPFADPPTNHYKPQPQPSDVGFGYLSSGFGSKHASVTTQEVEMEETDTNRYLPPPTPMTPLKSALKSPGAPPRSATANILSPTFREEQVLEKHEESTEKEQAKDLKVKFRVRVAKLALRGVSFGCSLIVVSMLATTLMIFNATRALPPRNGLPAWADPTPVWPQILVLVIASISLLMCIVIFYAYWKGGHKRAEKVAVYYTTFAVIFFLFAIIMWAIGAGSLNQMKTSSEGTDIWGWSCKDNVRRELFETDVSYGLVCRLNDWSLVCCIIEIVIEIFVVAIYGIVFYRYWSKRKLRKSMAVRDRARSDLYLAQLRSQSAPNTPGLGPFSPRDGGWRAPAGHPMYQDPHSAAENGEAGGPAVTSEGVQYATVQTPRSIVAPKPFTLQPPPIRVQGATPKLGQDGFERRESDGTSPTSPPLSPANFETQQTHMPAAPGEQQYASVPIPGAYASPLASPGLPPTYQQQQQQPMGGFDFGEEVTGQKY